MHSHPIWYIVDLFLLSSAGRGAAGPRGERDREVAEDREEIREADRCRRVAESCERIAARRGESASAMAGKSGRSESIVL